MGWNILGGFIIFVGSGLMAAGTQSGDAVVGIGCGVAFLMLGVFVILRHTRNGRAKAADQKAHRNLKYEYQTKGASAKTGTASQNIQKVHEDDRVPNLATQRYAATKAPTFDLFAIPSQVRELLWIGADQPFEEPSWIDPSMEVFVGTTILDAEADIGYYPSYKGLTPEQRYVYLKWLENIERPAPMGYVFLFYYGLERHLLFGNFEGAFKMVNHLRMHHLNGSFQSYSSDAMMLSSLVHGRPDLIAEIAMSESAKYFNALLAGMKNMYYSSGDLMRMCRGVGFTNMRYIKMAPELFLERLTAALIEKFGQPRYPVAAKDFMEAKGKVTLAIANYSLRPESRFSEAPDITTNTKFAGTVFELLTVAHNSVKASRADEKRRKA